MTERLSDAELDALAAIVAEHEEYRWPGAMRPSDVRSLIAELRHYRKREEQVRSMADRLTANPFADMSPELAAKNHWMDRAAEVDAYFTALDQG